jgi:hypothetical protein
MSGRLLSSVLLLVLWSSARGALQRPRAPVDTVTPKSGTSTVPVLDAKNTVIPAAIALPASGETAISVEERTQQGRLDRIGCVQDSLVNAHSYRVQDPRLIRCVHTDQRMRYQKAVCEISFLRPSMVTCQKEHSSEVDAMEKESGGGGSSEVFQASLDAREQLRMWHCAGKDAWHTDVQLRCPEGHSPCVDSIQQCDVVYDPAGILLVAVVCACLITLVWLTLLCLQVGGVWQSMYLVLQAPAAMSGCQPWTLDCITPPPHTLPDRVGTKKYT